MCSREDSDYKAAEYDKGEEGYEQSRGVFEHARELG